MKYWRIFIALLLAIVALVSFALPVFADQADPDSTPSVDSINIYRNLLETDDRFIVIYSNIPYATTPDATVSQAFTWQLIDTDGVTVLGQTTGYAYNDNGYGYNVFGFYFSAADALVWNQLYTIKLLGNPAIFDTPSEYNYPVALADYTTLTDSTENKQALALQLLTMAADLDIAWGLSSSASLLYESESGTVLSIYGEAFYRGAIYGVQALAPEAFRLVVMDIDADDRTWTSGFSDNLTTQFAGTWIEAAKTGGGTIFGLGYDLTSIIIVFGLCVGVLILNLWLSRDNWNAAVDIAVILVVAPMIDMIPLSFTALICALFVIYEGTKIKAIIR